MPLISVIVVLIVIGVILWLINQYLPIDPKIKLIINVLVVICVIIWLLQLVGLFAHQPVVPRINP